MTDAGITEAVGEAKGLALQARNRRLLGLWVPRKVLTPNVGAWFSKFSGYQLFLPKFLRPDREVSRWENDLKSLITV